MSIIIDWKGKQIPYYPEKKGQILRLPYQKKFKSKDNKSKDKIIIIIDKILEKDGEFGQPYLPIKLIGEVVRNGRNKKIYGMKYKAKKRWKKFWGHREPYTEIKIVSIEE